MASRSRVGIAAVVLAGGLAGAGTRAAGSPIGDLGGAVSAPELACFATPGAPLGLQLHVSHLDPGAVQLGLPAHSVTVEERVQTCAPVARRLAPAASPIIESIDLACYRIDAAPLPQRTGVRLEHADPVIATLPGHAATLVQPVELCLAVARAGAAPHPDVRRLVQFVALECYAVEPAAHAAFEVGAAPRVAVAPARGRVCLPVARTGQRVPGDVLAVLRGFAVEQLAAVPAEAPRAPVELALTHLHPQLATLPELRVALGRATAVMVPVSRQPWAE